MRKALLEKQITQGWQFLETARENLETHGYAAPAILLESKDAGRILLVLGGDVDPHEFFAKQLPQAVKEWQAHTVYITQDVTKTQTIPRDNPALLELIEQVGSRAAEEAGYIARSEALMCHIVTRRNGSWMLVWEYRRDGEKRIVMGARNSFGTDDPWKVFNGEEEEN